MRPPASRPVPRLALLAFAAWVVLLGGQACAPDDPVREALSLQREGQLEESIERLRAALDESPDDPQLNHFYGLALLQAGQRSSAHWPLRRAMEHPDWVVTSALPLASSLLSVGNHEAAMQALDRALEAEPDNVDALLLRAQAKLVSRVDYEGALADANRAYEIDPGSPRALVPRAAALLGLERLDEVAEVLEELERRFRDEELDASQAAHYCLTRATFAREKGDRELAEQQFERCLAELPGNDEVVIGVVDFFDSIGRGDRSLEIIRAALERAPQATLYRTALAQRLEARGEVEEAERLMREGLEVGGAPDFVVWANLSAHYQRRQQYDEAIAAFETSIAAVPEPPPAMRFEFAELLVLGGRYDRALEVADQIDVPAMRDLIRGRVHYQRGEYEQALAALDEGMRLWPDNAVARYLAARSAEQLGDFERAAAEYRYTVRADPAATDARYRLVRIRLAEGDLDSARAEAVQASDRSAPDPEAELAVFEALARGTRPEGLNAMLARLSRYPSVAARALVAGAGSAERVSGPAAAAAYILKAPGLDLTLPLFADALDALVGYLIEAGRSERAAELTAAALDAQPRSAAFLAVEAHRLERTGAAEDAVRRAWERALEADPEQPRALAGLARLAAARGDAEVAVDLHRRAARTEPRDPGHRRAAADLLVSLGRVDEARAELEALLFEHPTDREAALALGELLLASELREDLERALSLGERARRFRGASEAEALVVRARERLAAASAPAS